MLVADSYGYRIVDTDTGTVTTTFDLTEFGFPGAATAAAANNKFFALTDAVIRPGIFIVDRASGKTVSRWRDIKAPLGILLNSNGDPLVIDFATGTLIGLSQADRKYRHIIARDLAGPAGLAWASETSVYVSEALEGSVSRIELADGSRTVIAEGLAQPEGLTLMLDGRIALVEAGLQRLEGAGAIIPRPLVEVTGIGRGTDAMRMSDRPHCDYDFFIQNYATEQAKKASVPAWG